MFGDGVQYIVYMDSQKANKISSYLLDNPEKSYHINGVTKLIPSSMEDNGKKFVKEWLDNNHHHDEEAVEENHSHDINTDEFYQYFGYVYLDSMISFSFVRLFIYLTGITGIVFIVNYLNTKYHFM